MTETKRTTIGLGTISEGTLRSEDLISAYLSALDNIRLTRSERMHVNQIRREVDNLDHDADDPFGDMGDRVAELENILENHCPPYAYFGPLEGDGACFGVWASMDSLEEDATTRDRYLDPHDPRAHGASVLKMNAGDKFPSTRETQGIDYVMSVTDHGNVTLYARTGNRWAEAWSIV